MLYPASLAAGAGVTVTGSGFAPNEPVWVSYVAKLTAGGTAVEQVTVLAFPNGTFVAPNLPVPAGVSPGAYTVTAVGQQSNERASASLTVLPPAPAATPGITLDKVLILHTVSGKHISTKTLHLGERADFYVLYHTTNPGTLKPSATLTITKNGKLLIAPKLTSLILGHHAAFGAPLTLGKTRFLGRLYAHFKIMLGSASAKRDRRFYLVAK